MAAVATRKYTRDTISQGLMRPHILSIPKLKALSPKTLKFPKSIKTARTNTISQMDLDAKLCKVTKEAFPGIEYQYIHY